MTRTLPTIDQWESGVAPRETPLDQLNAAVLRDLYRLWKDRCGDAPWPQIHALAPRDMKYCLRHLHVYDVIDGGEDFRIRIYGTALVFDMNMDPTGTRVSQFPNSQIGARIAEACRDVLNRRSPICQAGSHVIDKKIYMTAHLEMLWLPLGPIDRIAQIMGATVVSLATLVP